MVKKNVNLMDFGGNPNIGIYMFVNDKFCLIGHEISDEKKKEIEKTFNVPVYTVSVLGTELIGLFISGNTEILIVPSMYEYEQKELEEICKTHEVKLIVIKDLQNTYGSNICVGNGKILINFEYSEEFESEIKKQTKYKIIRIENPIFKSIGATCRFMNNKYFFSQEYEEDQVKPILKEIGGVGTINQGSYYIASGVVGNSFGLIIGTMSSTVEIQNIVESLDYL
ncbi:MAG: hypothetical protein PF569_07485 [Candidatus Woesearchaeota archaeon]|jgi:translation initiation factor 6|nr:hypothetical protein [Candidatus Woesearchaeota archaeon]